MAQRAQGRAATATVGSAARVAFVADATTAVLGATTTQPTLSVTASVGAVESESGAAAAAGAGPAETAALATASVAESMPARMHVRPAVISLVFIAI